MRLYRWLAEFVVIVVLLGAVVDQCHMKNTARESDRRGRKLAVYWENQVYDLRHRPHRGEPCFTQAEVDSAYQAGLHMATAYTVYWHPRYARADTDSIRNAP